MGKTAGAQIGEELLTLPFHPHSLTMRLPALGLALALAAALLGAAASLPTPQPAGSAPAPPRLTLLFSANGSAACAGRCTLRAAAAACAPGAAAAAAEGETSGELLCGWNSLSIDGPAAPTLEAAVEVECWDPACTAQPRSFVAWRGAGCGSGAVAGPPALPALVLPGLANGTVDQVFTLGGGRPAVVISYSPPQPPLPAPAAAAAPASNITAAGLPPNNASAASGPGSLPPMQPSRQEQQCGGARHAALLKLALAVWTLGCAALGARL